MFSNCLVKISKFCHRRPFTLSKRTVPNTVTRGCSLESDKKERKLQSRIARVKLAAAYRGLCWYGLNEGVQNHLSVMAPDPDSNSEVMLIIPDGTHWNEVTPTRLIAINEQNEVVEGDGEPDITALCIHKAIYSVNPKIRCIMHTHMNYATALSCHKNLEILMVNQSSCRFYGEIAYDTMYNGLGNTFEEGKRMGEILGEKSVFIMGNHGVIIVGDCVEVPFDNMYYLERTAMFQVLAMSTGKEVHVIPEDIVKKTKEQIHKNLKSNAGGHLNYIIRTLQKTESDFKI